MGPLPHQDLRVVDHYARTRGVPAAYYESGYDPGKYGGAGENQLEQIWEAVLCNVNPIYLEAWVREAGDAENRHQMIKMTAPKVYPKTPWVILKTPRPKPREPMCNQWMRQGLCLLCREVGHFAAFCPVVLPPPALKTPERTSLETPARKGSSRLKLPRAL
ncbi:UNVERIFIED_CONTAM: hypothetical protein K2H54_005177 [Gekko kuhli]